MTLTTPADAADSEIHVISTVRHNGEPPLARYGRAIIQVAPAPTGRGWRSRTIT